MSTLREQHDRTVTFGDQNRVRDRAWTIIEETGGPAVVDALESRARWSTVDLVQWAERVAEAADNGTLASLLDGEDR